MTKKKKTIINHHIKSRRNRRSSETCLCFAVNITQSQEITYRDILNITVKSSMWTS
jgi:hypothetical protein